MIRRLRITMRKLDVIIILIVAILASCTQPVTTDSPGNQEEEPQGEVQPPVINLISVTPFVPRTNDELSVSVDAESNPEGRDLTFTYEWTLDGIPLPESSGSLASTVFQRGDEVSVTVQAFDGELSSDPAVTTVTIANTPPVVSLVTLTPSSPTTRDEITASYTVEDDDGDSVILNFDWYLDGVLVPGETLSTFPGSETMTGETISVSITPNDGIDDGQSVSSAELTVQ